jgi:hypothetical protein
MIDWTGFEHEGTEMFQIPAAFVAEWLAYTGA